MNEPLLQRASAATGLVLAAALAIWWLGSVRLALDHGSDPATSAAQALLALWLARGMALCILASRVGAVRGWRAGVASGLGVIAPSWPVAMIAWSASTVSAFDVAAAEALLLAGSVALPLAGSGLRRWLRRPQIAVVAGTTLGIALAAVIWRTSGFWPVAPL